MSSNLAQIPFKRIDGSDAALKDFSGKVVLIVNVASACGLTPQYEGLEKLYEAQRDRGLVVLGFPANNFAAQEPGSNEEIVEFCTTKFGVKFPLAEKVSVRGDDIHPLYQQLVAAQPKATGNADGAFRKKLEGYGLGPKTETEVSWNFEKFLLNRKGEVVGRFAPDIEPGDARITSAIEAELAK